MNPTPQPIVVGILTPSTPDAEVGAMLQDALRLTVAGASIIELDTTPGGPFHGDDGILLGMLVLGLTDLDLTVCVRTTDARVAGLAIDRGAAWIADPSGSTSDPEIARVVAAGGARCIIGPWPAPGEPRRRGTEDEIYAEGLVRNIARLLDAGVRSDRIVVDAGAGARRDDAEPWRMLNHIERLRSLGYPLIVDGSDLILDVISPDGATDEQLDDAAIAITILASGAKAWGIRTARVSRVGAALQRIFEPTTARISQ